MDIYILDKYLRRIEVVDDYETFIWTERWYTPGDFELDIPSTPAIRALFVKDTMLVINGSDRIMVVETTEDTTNDDGTAMLKITGRCLQKILEDRVARKALTTLTEDPTWSITSTPQNVIKVIFDTVCVNGGESLMDVIPYCNAATIIEGTTPFYSGQITVQIDPDTVAAVVQDICSKYNIGIRMVLSNAPVNPNSAELDFEIFSGNDNTLETSGTDVVIFSTALDNLQNTTELNSVTGYKNVAYVVTPNGHRIVYAPGADQYTAGFDRKVLLVKADDITDAAGAGLNALMLQRGQEELAKANVTYTYDGEVQVGSEKQYARDYNLGDRVALINHDGVKTIMRVSEQIFACDSSGERSYPTLLLESSISTDQ